MKCREHKSEINDIKKYVNCCNQIIKLQTSDSKEMHSEKWFGSKRYTVLKWMNNASKRFTNDATLRQRPSLWEHLKITSTVVRDL